MKKLKTIWNNNRVICVLAIIVIFCFCIIGTVMVKYFFGVNTSNYGDRLEDIAELEFKEEDQETLKTALEEQEQVEKATIKTKGKIIYIRIVLNASTTLDSAKQIATKSLESIGKDYQEKYDIEYTLVQEKTDTTEGYTIMGAKNINREKLIWNNNTPVQKSETKKE